jgi:hypothetical protein
MSVNVRPGESSGSDAVCGACLRVTAGALIWNESQRGTLRSPCGSSSAALDLKNSSALKLEMLVSPFSGVFWPPALLQDHCKPFISLCTTGAMQHALRCGRSTDSWTVRGTVKLYMEPFLISFIII